MYNFYNINSILRPIIKPCTVNSFPTEYNWSVNTQIARNYLQIYTTRITPLLDSILSEKTDQATQIDPNNGKMMESFSQLAKPGKHLRGALTVLGYQSQGGQDLASIDRASLALDIFQTSVLIHDDFMDHDDKRRGLPTLHKIFEDLGQKIGVTTSLPHYGASTAICVGDLGFYIAWEQLLSSGFSSDRILKAAQLYTDYIQRIAHGQILDVTNLNAQELSEQKIFNVYRFKTAEYTGALPLKLGSILAGCHDETVLKGIDDYGLALGWAFQIQDDILGMYGTEDETGKSNISDLREGKPTLLMVHLARHGTDEQIKFQKRVLGNSNITQAEADQMRNILKEAGCLEYVTNLKNKYLQQGLSAVPIISKDPGVRDILESFLALVVERTK